MSLTILQGDALTELRKLPSESVQCCVTSPPYWGLRDYSANGQLGLEKTPEEYVRKLVAVFREARRVLRKDGTLWLNLGDSYAGSWGNSGQRPELDNVSDGQREKNCDYLPRGGWDERRERPASSYKLPGLKPKDLCGIPWRCAFALQADGWWLRSDIIWAKPNPMPESVTDRPTKSHEYLFLLTKASSYFYDAEAIAERSITPELKVGGTGKSWHDHQDDLVRGDRKTEPGTNGQHQAFASGRNKRSVWTVATAPYPEAHFATYPPDLVKPCILAGTSAKGCCAKCGAPWERVVDVQYSPHWKGGTVGNTRKIITDNHVMHAGRENDKRLRKDVETLGWQPRCKCHLAMGGMSHPAFGDIRLPFKDEPIPCTVLDPFAGSGTTGMVALELGRRAVLIELNPKYIQLIEQRCDVTLGLALA